MPGAERRAPRSSRPGLLRIGDAARAVGVSPSALRLWERQGLIAPLRPAGAERRYGPDELTRLRCIRRLRVEGLNAAGIRRVLGRAADGGSPGSPSAAATTTGAARLDAPAVGARLRRERAAAGLSLRDVAARTGLSASFVSGLERGSSGASLAALERLTAAYDTSVAEILEEPTGSPGAEGGAADRVVRGAARSAVEAGRGVRIEELAILAGRLQPRLVALAPGAVSDLAGDHEGEAFLYVLEGRIAVWLADLEHHELGPGDALTFPSALRNRCAALGADEARILWIATPPLA